MGSNYPITKLPNRLPSRNRRHYRNVITVFHRGCVLLQVADVFVVEVHVDEGAELAVVVIKMTAQVGVLGDESAEGLADGRAADVNSRLFPGVLAQWRG